MVLGRQGALDTVCPGPTKARDWPCGKKSVFREAVEGIFREAVPGIARHLARERVFRGSGAAREQVDLYCPNPTFCHFTRPVIFNEATPLPVSLHFGLVMYSSVAFLRGVQADRLIMPDAGT